MNVNEFLSSHNPSTLNLPPSISRFCDHSSIQKAFKKYYLSSEVASLRKQKSQFVTKDKIQLNFKRLTDID